MKLFIWIATGIGLGVLLISAETSRIQSNDPDPAFQRPGFLNQKPIDAPTTIPIYNGRSIIFFARSLNGQQLIHDLAVQSDLAQTARIVVVTQDGSKPTVMNGISLALSDSNGSIARSFGFREPIDAGYPIGYAIIDSEQQIRYTTLDPSFSDESTEILKIVRATP